ncbi:MAG: hypothetical protein M3P18_20905, partial [Actinomycetota bacterium]|nr:hypothetical protein [Actinomycetota bacterium]
ITLALSDLTDLAGHVKEQSDVCGGITVDPEKLKQVAPGASAVVMLKARKAPTNAGDIYGATLAAASCAGPAVRLTLSEVGGDIDSATLAAAGCAEPVARLTLSIAGLPAGTVPATPLVDNVKETIYRGSPHGRDSIWVVVKGKATEKEALTDKQVVGAISGEGRIGVVTYAAGHTKEVAEGAKSIRFNIDGLNGATGTFSGKIVLISGDATSAVTLTITRKDWWLYPTLATLAGILIALVVQRLAGVTIAGHRLRARLVATGPRYADVRRRLVEAADGEPWGSYTISNLPEARQQIADHIDSDIRAAYTAINQKKIDDLTGEIEKLEQGIEQLDSVDHHAQPLNNAIESAIAVEAGAPERRGSDGKLVEPAIVINARTLLVGEPLTIDELRERLTALDTEATAVGGLAAYEALVANDNRQLDELAHELSGHDAEIEQASETLVGVWHDLWTAPTMAELEQRSPRQRIEGVEATIAQLWGQLPKEKEEAVRAFAPSYASPEGAQTLGLQAPEELDYTPGGVEHELKAARIEQGVVVLLSVVIALVTALTALYVGKVFGSFWDYATALTWGLATQTALTTIASALDGLGGLSAIGRRVRGSASINA